MSTQAQIDANRANAQHSTGPQSSDAKARVAANAVTHGLCSRKIMLTGENIEEFFNLRRQVEAAFHLEPGIDNFFVDDAALAWLRLERIAAWETAVIDASFQNQEIPVPIARLFTADHDVALNRLHRYEANVRGSLRRALAQLREIHKERLAAAQAAAQAEAAAQAAAQAEAAALQPARPVRPLTPEAIAELLDETKPISAPQPRPDKTGPPDSGR